MSKYILHLGDCLDPVSGLSSLPDKSVDHVITDPPYSEHVHTKSRRGLSAHNGKNKGWISEGRDLGFESLRPEIIRAAVSHFSRIARRWVLVFSDFESGHLWRTALEESGLEYIRTGCWEKLGGAPQFTGDRPAVFGECITIAHRPGRKRWHGGGRMGIWKFATVVERGDRTQRVHTTQKPISLMEALVRDFTDPGETVLDPFAGSGTTLVAAKRLGRSAIGWERNPKYHAIAEKRLALAREQFGLWEGAA